MPQKLVVIGISGAGRRVIDIVIETLESVPQPQYELVGAVDDRPSDVNLARLAKQGVPYLGTRQSVLRDSPPFAFLLGIGDPQMRRHIAFSLAGLGHKAARLVHPLAHVSRSASIGDGCVISPGVELSTNVRLGKHVHVTANATISHDTVLQDFVSVSPGAVVAGNCSIGADSVLGAGSVVLQGLTVGEASIVGASACVTQDVPAHSVVRGIPAR